jgi:hypothetical protein
MYLVKFTCKQELGWRQGRARQAGPYLLIPKRWHQHLPSLSDTVYNDSAPLRLRIGNAAAIVPYVWHNAAHLDDARMARGTTRRHDEFRVYISGFARNHMHMPEPEDAVIFRAAADSGLKDDFELRVVKLASNLHNALLRLKGARSNYFELDAEAAEKSGVTAAFFLNASPVLPIADDTQPRQTIDISVPAIGDDVFDKLSRSEDEALSSRTSAETFRDLVLNAYKRQCAFSGRAIELGNGLANVEAAHIKPRVHGGLNLTCNGIALCRDLHWAFDKGAFTLTPDFRAEVHSEVTDEFLRSIHGRKATLPNMPYNLPRLEFLEHHRHSVFGLFKSRGSLRRDS